MARGSPNHQNKSVCDWHSMVQHIFLSISCTIPLETCKEGSVASAVSNYCRDISVHKLE